MRVVVSCLLACCAAVFFPAHAEPPGYERCTACHAGTEATKELGPSLAGVFGRSAGSREDFRYSRAMSRSGITWDAQSLDAYLKAPADFMPGTRMPFEGIASDAERAAIIEYLKTFR